MRFLLALPVVLALMVLVGASYENLVDIDGRLIASQNLANGHAALMKFGFSTDVDTSEVSVSEIVENGRNRCATDTTALLAVFASSDDENDAELEITVQGVDSNWDDLTVVMTLGEASASGTLYSGGEVGGPNQWLRINRAFVSDTTATVGTVFIHTDLTDSADGTPDTPATQLHAVISATEQQTLHTCYTVPDDYGAGFFITSSCGTSLSSGASGNATFRLRSLSESGVSRTQLRWAGATGATECVFFDPPLKYEPRTMMEFTADGSVVNMDVTGQFSGYLLR